MTTRKNPAQGTCAGYRHRGLDAARDFRHRALQAYPGMEKTRAALPVIMLTARGEEGRPGARSRHGRRRLYLSSRFPFRNFIARVKALLRRTDPNLLTDKLVAGDIELDRDSRRAAPQRHRTASRPDGVSPARIPDAQPGPRLHPRAAARQCLGSRRLYRRAHRRCPMSAACARPLRRNRVQTRSAPVRGAGYAFEGGDKGPAAKPDHLDSGLLTSELQFRFSHCNFPR